jgi:aminoglycoside 3-N-acetyltransferase
MITKQQLTEDLRAMGIQPNDTVLIHISMKSVGEVEGGADGLIDAFCEYLTDGLFLVPTHTWDGVNADNPIYDVRTSVPCIGAVPRVAAFRKDGIRSLHPTHSIWAYGKNAESFVRGEENAASPAPVGFCWDKLADMGAKILLIGVSHNRNTFIHSIDERMNLPDRLGDPYALTIVDHCGNALDRSMRPHRCSRTNDVSKFYINFEKPLVALSAQSFGQLGNAQVRIVDAQKCREIVSRIYSRSEADIFTQYREIPESLYK